MTGAKSDKLCYANGEREAWIVKSEHEKAKTKMKCGIKQRAIDSD